jgi:hypothetical protein
MSLPQSPHTKDKEATSDHPKQNAAQQTRDTVVNGDHLVTRRALLRGEEKH